MTEDHIFRGHVDMNQDIHGIEAQIFRGQEPRYLADRNPDIQGTGTQTIRGQEPKYLGGRRAGN